MKIIIVGNGKVGFTLAEQLVNEDHDVTIVDDNETALERAADMLDIMPVRGNGVSAAVLREAGVETADILVAATSLDEVNMVCCLLAKKLGCKYTMARIRNPEYNSTVEELKRGMGIDLAVNPERSAAVEISRLLRFPSAANVETFCRGRVELMGVRLQPHDFMIGKPLSELSSEVKKLSLLFCAVDRDGEFVIPDGSFVPEVGDKLYVIGRPTGLNQFFRLLGRHVPQVSKVLIVGGGRIATYLADLLTKMKMQVKVIEQDEQRCRKFSESQPKVTVICGDGMDQELLETERLTSFDAFVALTGRDEDNFLIALYAAQQGVSKVVSKVNRPHYASIARIAGLDSQVSPKQLTASHILQVVRGMQQTQGSVMNALYRIADGAAEAMEFTVTKATENLGVPLRELRLKRGVLLAVIVRGADIIIPEGSSCIQEGDSVIVISREELIQDLNDIYREDYNGGGGKR